MRESLLAGRSSREPRPRGGALPRRRPAELHESDARFQNGRALQKPHRYSQGFEASTNYYDRIPERFASLGIAAWFMVFLREFQVVGSSRESDFLSNSLGFGPWRLGR